MPVAMAQPGSLETSHGAVPSRPLRAASGGRGAAR